MKNNALKLVLTVSFLTLSMSCGGKKTTIEEAKKKMTEGEAAVICDPLAGQNQAQSGMGLSGTLSYLPNGQVGMYNGVQDFLSKSTPIAALYLGSLQVPTRLFDQGFPVDGGLLTNEDGSVLQKFYGFRLGSEIGLRSGDAQGEYQFGLISDDGAMVINKNTGKKLVESDGDHPAKFGCGSELVTLSSGTHIPIEVTYFQGMPAHVTLMLLWRKIEVDSNGKPTVSLNDPACGQAGNDLFFDATNGSTPQQLYLQMQSRGWKPLDAGNFFLPAGSDPNPCN